MRLIILFFLVITYNNIIKTSKQADWFRVIEDELNRGAEQQPQKKNLSRTRRTINLYMEAARENNKKHLINALQEDYTAIQLHIERIMKSEE